MNSIGLAGAFAGGVLSLLSPCSAMLLPAFFAYAFADKRTLLGRTLLFFLGLATVLVPIGMGLGGVGSLLINHRDALVLGGGILLIIFGLMSLLGVGFSIPGLGALAQNTGGTGPLRVYLTGCVYGFAGFCAGPLLGAVLTQSLLGGASVYGGVLMLAYAAGMTVPLFILALIWRNPAASSTTSWLQRGRTFGPFHVTTVGVISGILFIVLGVGFIATGGTTALPGFLDTATQAEWQAKVGEWAGSITDLHLLFVLFLIAAIGFGIRAARSSRTESNKNHSKN